MSLFSPYDRMLYQELFKALAENLSIDSLLLRTFVRV